jgi:FMN-dependent oxidoreductase (nitrilotriacetate monooxygenase family)
VTKQLHLNLFLLGVGHSEAIWRHPSTQPERAHDLAHYQELAAIAERGRFDSLFIADGPLLPDSVRYNMHLEVEPLTLLSALAASTERIGLIGTASTTYSEPYNLARQFASLDQLSGGRGGWNIVTGSMPDAAHNFGLDAHPSQADRYARADEFVEVVEKLWDSYPQEAIVRDRASGQYIDLDLVAPIDHEGERFRVRGPLNVPRSPQGQPVRVQAGASETGKLFAARHAEVMFTASFSLEEALAHATEVKKLAGELGRDPAHLIHLPGVTPVLGSTEAEAQATYEEYLELTRPEASIAGLKVTLGGIDLSDHPLDAPFPDIGDSSKTLGQQRRFEQIVEMARDGNLTLRQVLQRFAAGHGHRVFVGTPEQLADEMQAWLEAGAADGFNVHPPTFPDSLVDFVDHVIPILQRRGIFREEYTGRTLREHYGLPFPAIGEVTRATGEPALAG